jgi:O-antigen/teichoic acid export membrane protein
MAFARRPPLAEAREAVIFDRVRRSDIVRHGSVVFGGVVVANVFNYLYYVFLGRLANVEVYGEVTALASSMLLLGAPASVGQLIVARIAADLDARGDRAALRRLADVVTVRTLVAGLVVIVVAALARDPIAHFLNLKDSAPVVATAAAAAMLFCAFVQRGVLQGAHLFRDFSASMTIEAFARVGIGLALVVPFTSTGALAGAAVGLGITVLFHLRRFHVRFGARRAPVPVERAVLWRIVTGVGLGQLTLTVLTFYDLPLVKHAFDARSAGLYAAAALVGRAVIAAVTFVPTIVLPKVAARVAAGRSPLPLLFTGLGLAATVIVIAAVAGMIAPRFVVSLIAGRQAADAAPLIVRYVAASGALSLATVVAAYNFGLHRYGFVVPACVVACAEVVVLAAWHPTLSATVGVLAVGHTCVFAATLYRVGAPVGRGALEATEEQPLPPAEPIG